MSRVRVRGEEIRRYILENVELHAGDISKLTADKFEITRQAVNKHIKKLAKEGALGESGKTRNRQYVLAPKVDWGHVYQITIDLEEHLVWQNDISKILGQQPENVLDIWQYGLTEMLNNARDHSGGSEVTILIRKTSVTSEMAIIDNGVGIFRKIQSAMNLLDERHAIFELAKGKLTTDPKHHTGEGIFFTSRMFDSFDILSGGVYFNHEYGKAEDWLFERHNPSQGTIVWLKLNNHTARTLKKVFDKFTSDDGEFGFTKTVVPVRLAQYGNDKLVSRSQAKRVLARVELFKTVMFDFGDVPTIGQAFADEIFRVFAHQHPEIEIIPFKANSEVKRMIERVKVARPEAEIPKEVEPEPSPPSIPA
jgi:biotin operon repressor/anti-sigma regulatory factor (Ser/Thr protein kinase)